MEDKKIKVIFAVNDFTIAGVQRLYVDILERLSQSEYEVHVLTLFEFPSKKNFYYAIPPHVVIHRLNFKSFRDAKAWISLYKALRKMRPDIIVSSLFFCNTVLRVLRPLFRYRIITTEHNTYIFKPFSQILVDKILSFLTYKIVAVSKTVAEFTSRQEHISQSKFYIIHNGIKIGRLSGECARVAETLQQHRRRLGFQDCDKVVINVGRLTMQKNQLPLVEAFVDVHRMYPEYKLIILGEGSLHSTIDQRIRELGAEDYIFLLGAREDIVPYYALSEFFVSTSLIEGFGIAHAEALCCGLPILSTKTAGPDEMIEEGYNGYFIDSPTAPSICAGLLKMIHADLGTMKVNARRSVERFSIDKTVEKYDDILKTCLGKEKIKKV